MAWDTVRKEFAKYPFHFVEIEVDSTTYRFCRDISPLPIGFEGYPTLVSVNVSPATINLDGGLGIRATASAKIGEVNDYSIWGTIANPVSFWRRWRAENPYYKNQRISVFSGYLVNNTFDISNFIQRDYIIERFTWASDGVSISMVDPLKLANNSTAKWPIESKGSLENDILDTDTTIDLLPTGIGDAEYPSSDFYVRVGDEVMFCTSRTDDELTVTRGQWNTAAEEQSEGDTVQLCVWYDSATVSEMAYDLCVNGAGIDSSYINQTAWDAESSAAFANTYTALITEPEGVSSLIKELADSAPFYLYYDDRYNLIQFKALSAPPASGQALTYDGNLLQGSVGVTDEQDMRVSTVVIYYGLYDPTKDLDETSNYRKVYIREDEDSVTNYGSRAYKTVYSRFISSDNKTAAVLAGARMGRRFASAPRKVVYKLDPKDANVWTADNVTIETDLILASGGSIASLVYQVLSAGENMDSNTFSYTALEHTYGPAVDGDDDVEDPNVILIYISGDHDQLKTDGGIARSLRDYYDDVQVTIDAAYDVRFIIEPSAVCGSSDNSAYAIRTGTWPELTEPPTLDIRGLVVGKGGDGADVGDTAENGGPAILIEDDFKINNSGTIGGGGGGGGSDIGSGSDTANAAGGGGAGYTNGAAGLGTVATGIRRFARQPEPGTNTTGGLGGYASNDSPPDPNVAVGGNGGDLGQAGTLGGGTAGAAINENGYTVTYINAGTILGAII